MLRIWSVYELCCIQNYLHQFASGSIYIVDEFMDSRGRFTSHHNFNTLHETMLSLFRVLSTKSESILNLQIKSKICAYNIVSSHVIIMQDSIIAMQELWIQFDCTLHFVVAQSEEFIEIYKSESCAGKPNFQYKRKSNNWGHEDATRPMFKWFDYNHRYDVHDYHKIIVDCNTKMRL